MLGKFEKTARKNVKTVTVTKCIIHSSPCFRFILNELPLNKKKYRDRRETSLIDGYCIAKQKKKVNPCVATEARLIHSLCFS